MNELRNSATQYNSPQYTAVQRILRRTARSAADAVEAYCGTALVEGGRKTGSGEICTSAEPRFRSMRSINRFGTAAHPWDLLEL